MKTIKIILPKEEYNAGETIRGAVEIRSSEGFSFTEMYIEFICQEHTRVTVGSGDDSDTYDEVYYHHSERLTLMEPGEFNQDEVEIPFTFSIPEELPSSYSGSSGDIEYRLYAKIGQKWRLDPQSKAKIMVTRAAAVSHPNSLKESLLDDENVLLDVEIEKSEVYLGEDIIVNFRVDDCVKMNGIRVDLIARELAVAKGHSDTSTKLMTKEFISEDEIVPRSWYKVRIPTHQDMLATYRGPLITLSIVLKIVVEIPWRIDKDLQIEIVTIRTKPPAKEEDSSWF